jgi:hypothetical protein
VQIRRETFVEFLLLVRLEQCDKDASLRGRLCELQGVVDYGAWDRRVIVLS